MNVLITGVQNAVEESIVRLAAERMGSRKGFRLLCFSDFDGLEGNPVGELELIKAAQQKVRRAIREKAPAAGRGHLVVSGYCTVKTKMGFFPVLTAESVKAMRPDIMVHISVDPLGLEGKAGNVEEFRDHQAIEKTYAILLCASAGVGLKVIHCGIDGAREAAGELLSLLRGIMVDE